MLITRRNQYALRAIFELAWRGAKAPVKVSSIAKAQDIPTRFLEVILGQLKRSGLVKSKRGRYGGYKLIPPPGDITVGRIMRAMERDPEACGCLGSICDDDCPFIGSCSFFPVWSKVQDAIFGVFDETTIQDLLEIEIGDGSSVPSVLTEFCMMRSAQSARKS